MHYFQTFIPNNLPKVSEASKAAMEADLTLEELQATMKSKGMKDAPGPDGIPYSVYIRGTYIRGCGQAATIEVGRKFCSRPCGHEVKTLK